MKIQISSTMAMGIEAWKRTAEQVKTPKDLHGPEEKKKKKKKEKEEEGGGGGKGEISREHSIKFITLLCTSRSFKMWNELDGFLS